MLKPTGDLITTWTVLEDTFHTDFGHNATEPLWRCCTASEATDRSLDGDVVGVVIYTSVDQVAIALGTKGHPILLGESEENNNHTLKDPFQDRVTGKEERPFVVDGPVNSHQTGLADENRSVVGQPGVAASSVACCGRLYQNENMETFKGLKTVYLRYHQFREEFAQGMPIKPGNS